MATRSPACTPSSVERVGRLAHLVLQVGVGDGRGCRPGSPSQWKATRSPWPASTWRSTQLTATLSLPPTNHLANGRSHSRTSVHGWSQVSRSACWPRTPDGQRRPRRSAAAVTLAASARSSGGANVRVSCRRFDSPSDTANASGSIDSLSRNVPRQYEARIAVAKAMFSILYRGSGRSARAVARVGRRCGRGGRGARGGRPGAGATGATSAFAGGVGGVRSAWCVGSGTAVRFEGHV